MPWCKIGSSPPFLVDNCSECVGGRCPAPPPGGDGGPGGGGDNGGHCFIRSVLTRAFGELILDIGMADRISATLARNADVPRAPQGRSARRDLLDVSPTLRVRLATRVMRTILKLAATYPTGLEFRVNVFKQTQRGRQILEYYERYLSEIYDIARGNYTLLNDLASAWLEVRPFVASMVRVATAKDGGSQRARRHRLSAQSYEQGQDLIRRFTEASNDEGFRRLTRELGEELAEYRGLQAEQAIAKLRASPAARA